jgi:hypothetical protein
MVDKVRYLAGGRQPRPGVNGPVGDGGTGGQFASGGDGCLVPEPESFLTPLVVAVDPPGVVQLLGGGGVKPHDGTSQTS